MIDLELWARLAGTFLAGHRVFLIRMTNEHGRSQIRCYRVACAGLAADAALQAGVEPHTIAEQVLVIRFWGVTMATGNAFISSPGTSVTAKPRHAHELALQVQKALNGMGDRAEPRMTLSEEVARSVHIGEGKNKGLVVGAVDSPYWAAAIVFRMMELLEEPGTGMGFLLVPKGTPSSRLAHLTPRLLKHGITVLKAETDFIDDEAEELLKEHGEGVKAIEDWANSQG